MTTRGLCPFAKHRLIPENETQPSIVPYIIIDHTQAGTGSLYDFWNAEGRKVESTFWIARTGLIEQYENIFVRADANYQANRWFEDGIYKGAVSIETENSREATNAYYREGDHDAFNRDPWTDAQLSSLIKLHDWIAKEAGGTIKRQRCDEPLGSGLGYHSMWGTGPTPWIPYSSRGKECPGRTRIEQHNDLLLPIFVNNSFPSPPPTTPDIEVPTMADMIVREQDTDRKAVWAIDIAAGTRRWIGPRTLAAYVAFRGESGWKPPEVPQEVIIQFRNVGENKATL